MPTNDITLPGSTESSPVDHGAFDINRFNRTPEAQWRVGKQRPSELTVHQQEVLQEASTEAYQLAAGSTLATEEYKQLTPEEMAELIQRPLQTAQLIEWMRVQAMGGQN